MGPEIVASSSVLWPGTADKLGMRLDDSGLRLVLARDLPQAVGRLLPGTVRTFLSRAGVDASAISFWLVHPGGPKVLDAVQAALGLSEGDLRAAWDVWERYGNISSPTLFFIMRALQERDPPAEGALGMMLAFGPGLSCEMVLLRSRGWLGRRA
jgi:alkylresorcinol/alkylpyrone synthase